MSIGLYSLFVFLGVHSRLAHCERHYPASIFHYGSVRSVSAARLICLERLSLPQSLVESIVQALPVGLWELFVYRRCSTGEVRDESSENIT